MRTFVVEWEETVAKDEFVYAKTRVEAVNLIECRLKNEYTITGVREIETDDDNIEGWYWREDGWK